MSLLREALWLTEFDGPMPKGITYWQFAKLREEKWATGNIKEAWTMLRVYEELAKKFPDDLSLQAQIHENMEAERNIIKRNVEGMKNVKKL